MSGGDAMTFDCRGLAGSTPVMAHELSDTRA